MSAEPLIRFTTRGKWHAVPYGDSYHETRTLCGLSFCPNQIERKKYSLNAWDVCMTCRKLAEKEAVAS